jgi:hypothetical protein
MPSPADNVILTFPPRMVSQGEQVLLAEWFAATQRADLDVERAFISERRGDDPNIVGRIVVLLRSSRHPAFLVFAPTESLFWVVTAAPAWDKVNRFRTLRAALNSIRPVLDEPNTMQNSELSGYLA